MLTKKQNQTLESIQNRALRIISPGETYENICVALGLPTLKERRDTLCKSLFNDIIIIIIIIMNLYSAGYISQNAHRHCNVCMVTFYSI